MQKQSGFPSRETSLGGALLDLLSSNIIPRVHTNSILKLDFVGQ